MIVDEIENVRVQSIVDDWKTELSRQLTVGDRFGEILVRIIDSPEVKKSIAFFESQGLKVTIKKNSRMELCFGHGIPYTLIFSLNGNEGSSRLGGKNFD